MNSLIVASDVCLFRQGMSSILANDDRLVISATARDDQELLRQIQNYCPTVVLLDMGMPHAFHACVSVRSRWPAIKVIALCVSESANEIGNCAKAGVSGFVSKTGSLEEVVSAVRNAQNGELACSARVSAFLLNKINSLATASDSPYAVEHLTPRELEVVELVSEGLTNKQIARRLKITISTTKNHVHHLLEKLGAHHRAEAGAIYRRAATIGNQIIHNSAE